MTDKTPLYLKPGVQVKPLVEQWYAWSYLMPPATAARNLTERHLRIMNSYILAPEAHASAVNDPKLRGGPFIDYGGQRVDDITALRDRTLRQRKNLIELSGMLAELDALIAAEARGFGLQAVYAKVPDGLHCYVELLSFFGEHSDLDIKTKSAYLVGVAGRTLMFAADP